MNSNTVKIKKGLLLELLQACVNTHPNEFFAFLGKDKDNIVNHFVIVPIFYTSQDSVSYRTDTLPMDSSIAGTIHSHPGLNYKPSKADLHSFEKKGFIHLIITYPYNSFNSIHAFSKNGKEIGFEIIL